ncbi:MAG: class I SAM-dependent methyltransferase [Ideonella sp.]|nr:class I SAM-dependent methyltransferase [Ideonella sp.]
MSTTTTALATSARLPSAPLAARSVLRLLRGLAHGTLALQLPDGSHAQFGAAQGEGPRASMRWRNWNVCRAALRSGDIGVAESYFAGDWTTPDLAALLKLFAANRDALERAVYGSWWGSIAHRVRHLLNRNSRRGSRRNIHAHYDLGNDFYRLWLDPTLNYSSAWFEGDRSRDMASAQQAKMRRAIAECELAPGQRLLEIGCGWGALAECAARDFGACVTGVTLSAEQLAHARQRLADAGLADRAELRFQDYRDIRPEPQAYDAIVSIEMFEAVGREYWSGYFEALKRNLKPGGKACIQTITIRDDLFARYLQSTDFIQQYIFPGGLLPSPAEFRKAAAAAGLEVINELDFGLDYAETLRRWRERFAGVEGGLRGLGFDERFCRIWEFYLAYCEAAFAAGSTSVMQFTLRAPQR